MIIDYLEERGLYDENTQTFKSDATLLALFSKVEIPLAAFADLIENHFFTDRRIKRMCCNRGNNDFEKYRTSLVG